MALFLTRAYLCLRALPFGDKIRVRFRILQQDFIRIYINFYIHVSYFLQLLHDLASASVGQSI